MEDIVKKIKSLEESGLLIKEISETIKNETKEQKGGLFSMSLGTLAVRMLLDAIRMLLGFALTGKGVVRAGEDTIRAGERTNRAGEKV